MAKDKAALVKEQKDSLDKEGEKELLKRIELKEKENEELESKAKEKTAEAAVARIDKHLKQGDMSGALSLAQKLPDNVRQPAQEWLSKLAARAGVDQAIAKIENQLKASLGTGAAATDKKG